MLTTTAGSSDPAIYERPSCMRLIPGDDEDVMTRAPAADAPNAMLIDVISLSA
jgi:hypothetical protein